MEQEVVKYDPTKLMEMVRDRIRATYVSLIPDEQWTQMVKKEVDNFFAETDWGYGNRPRSSVFREIVHEELKKKAVEKIAASIETMIDWNGAPQEALKKIIQEKGQDMIFATLENIIGTVLSNARRVPM